MRIAGFSIKIEWIVIAALVLYILHCNREHLTVAPETAGATKSCPSGYAYDAIAKTCNPVNDGQGTGSVAPPSPDAIEATHPSAAPAISTGPVTSTAPMTTPVPTMPPVKPSPPSSVMPATSVSSIPARH